MTLWVPFGLDDEAVEDFKTLVSGVPEWLKEPLVAWASDRLTTGDSGTFMSRARLLKLQSETRVSLGVAAASDDYHLSKLGRQALRKLSDMQLLRIVDYLLGEISTSSRSSAGTRLETILSGSGSCWQVGERLGKAGLVDRVPEGVRVAVETTIDQSGTAGTLLARAWSHVHGISKNDTAGYADAVRAVEIAAIPVVLNNNPEATLGTVIARMRTEGDWQLPLREHNHAPSPEMLIQLLRTLWRGHSDRHGSEDYRDVSHVEARAAVVLAATLVDWFTSGAIARRSA